MRQSNISKYFAVSKKSATSEDKVFEDFITKQDDNPNASKHLFAYTASASQSSPAYGGVTSNSDREKFSIIFSNAFDSLHDEYPTASAPLETVKHDAAWTPLEKQVLALRRDHPQCLLMVECGYRYERRLYFVLAFRIIRSFQNEILRRRCRYCS